MRFKALDDAGSSSMEVRTATAGVSTVSFLSYGPRYANVHAFSLSIALYIGEL